jgi:hypothetical protein
VAVRGLALVAALLVLLAGVGLIGFAISLLPRVGGYEGQDVLTAAAVLFTVGLMVTAAGVVLIRATRG